MDIGNKILLGVVITVLVAWVLLGLWLRWRVSIRPDGKNPYSKSFWFQYDAILVLLLLPVTKALLGLYHKDGFMVVLIPCLAAFVIWRHRVLFKDMIQGKYDNDPEIQMADKPDPKTNLPSEKVSHP